MLELSNFFSHSNDRQLTDFLSKANLLQQTQLQKKPLKPSLSEIKGTLAILPIFGTILPFQNPLSELAGFSTVDSLIEELELLVTDDGIENILLDVHSGGGSVDGIHELFLAIRNATLEKHVYAYVQSIAASAAYIAISAVNKIYTDPTASLGSIGVKFAATIERTEGVEEVVLVSRHAPLKHCDLESTECHERIINQLSAIEAVFIADVAQGRRVEEARVIRTFGQGDILIGQQAVDFGLADEIVSYRELLKTLSNTPKIIKAPQPKTPPPVKPEPYNPDKLHAAQEKRRRESASLLWQHEFTPFIESLKADASMSLADKFQSLLEKNNNDFNALITFLSESDIEFFQLIYPQWRNSHYSKEFF